MRQRHEQDDSVAFAASIIRRHEHCSSEVMSEETYAARGVEWHGGDTEDSTDAAWQRYCMC